MKNNCIKIGQAAFIGTALIYLGVFIMSTFSDGYTIQNPVMYTLQLIVALFLCVFFFNLFSKVDSVKLSSVRLSLISSFLLVISNLGLLLSVLTNSTTLNNVFSVICSVSYILLTLSIFLVVYKFKNLYSGFTISSAIVTLIFTQLMFGLLLNNILNLEILIDLTYMSILSIVGIISSAMLVSTFTKAAKSIV